MKYYSILYIACFTVHCLSCSIPVLAQTEEEKFERRIRVLLTATEFSQVLNDILSHEDRVLPVLEKVLSTPQVDREAKVQSIRALVVLREMGKKSEKLRPLVKQQLLTESSSLRFRAVEALASIGNTEDVPVLVAMLYDPGPYGYVRYQAVKALAKMGGESALLAIEIWEKQAIEADKERVLQDKWIIGPIAKAIDEAKASIRKRIENRPARAEK